MGSVEGSAAASAVQAATSAEVSVATVEEAPLRVDRLAVKAEAVPASGS